MTAIDDEALKKFRERSAARVAEIKAAILRWLEPRDNVGDSVCVTIALLDIALDRHVEVHHGDDFELIEAAYNRALKRWRDKLQ